MRQMVRILADPGADYVIRCTLQSIEPTNYWTMVFLVLKTLTFDQVATHGEERRMEKFINTELLWSTFTTANGS